MEVKAASVGSEEGSERWNRSDDAVSIFDVEIESPMQNCIDWKNPPLFKPRKVRVKEYWEFIALVAPNADEKKEWKTSEAICAYCTKCKMKLPWTIKNPKQVQCHMDKNHHDFIVQSRSFKRKPMEPKTIQHFFSKKLKKDLQPAQKADQVKGKALLVHWVSKSLRPFTIVEDAGFRDIVDFLCNLNRNFSVPGRQKLQGQLVMYGELVREKMKQKIEDEVTYFSGTTDIWSSRTTESFMAITLHALSKDFEMINMTLEVDPLKGKHTGQFMKQRMIDSFENWGIQKEKLVMMLRDNASNAIKACNEWGINSFGCIGHTLHLIVGPLFLQKKNSTNEESTCDNCEDIDDNLLDNVVDYDEEELVDIFNNFTDKKYKESVKKLNKVVTDFRKVAKYIRKSTIAKEKLDTIQNTNDPVSVDLDVKTRWNSTLHMLQKLMRMKTSLCIFMQYLKLPDGKREFNHKKLPTIGEKDWALIEGICIILGIFAKATEALSGEKYPTFVYSMPILRKVKMHLSNDDMFLRNSVEEDVKQFHSIYGDEIFFPSIVSTLEIIRMGLLKEFKTRFSGITIDILWTTILDPRCRSLKHLTSMEREEAKNLLIKEVLQTFKNEDPQGPASISNVRLDVHGFDIFDSSVKVNEAEESTVQHQLQLQNSAKREVENYLDPTIIVSPETSSLDWWRENKYRFPHVAVLARKWLCVTATSTPSERVFSDCGLGLTAKRSRLKGYVLRDQVMIRRNACCVNITQDDIVAKLSKTNTL